MARDGGLIGLRADRLVDVEAGVKIAYGTDSGVPFVLQGDRVVRWRGADAPLSGPAPYLPA